MKNKFKLHDTMRAEEWKKEREETEERICKGCNKKDFLRNFKGRVIKHLTFLQVSFLNICGECFSRKNVKAVAKARKEDKDYARACMYWKRSWKRGIKSDLKLRDIRMMLTSNCRYCEANDIPMTLDRKDSSGGYTRSNTVPCCSRCNIIKSDMPWEAWERLIPAVRNVSKLGLFQGWKSTGREGKMPA